jgi:hypothetical protein
MPTPSFQPGARVRWNWGASTAEGTVRKVFTDRVERTIKGSHITRNADDAHPAYLIEQDDGARVLKSHSELTRLH